MIDDGSKWEEPLRPASRRDGLAAVLHKHFPEIEGALAADDADSVDENVCVLLSRAGLATVRKTRGQQEIAHDPQRKGKASATAGLRRLQSAIDRRDQYAELKTLVELNEVAAGAIQRTMGNEDGILQFGQKVTSEHVAAALASVSKSGRPPAGISDHVAREFVRLWRWHSGKPVSEPANLKRHGGRDGEMAAFVTDCMRLYGLPAPGQGASWARILRDC
jgi:hypothetical protein